MPGSTARRWAFTPPISTDIVPGQWNWPPGATSYDRTLYAQAADVTSSLKPGENTFAIELSDGWYRGQVGAFRHPAGWGTTLSARAELHIELADGTRRVVITDGDWTSTPSATTRADLMDGQTVDYTATGGTAVESPPPRRRRPGD
ncbi:alpha-L-rhamnosidase N-terminal domain-containing protein [Paenarthrobacter sp. S56]|uniref:alpha-L-rhamnosidase N-terminal domain-containing protein n=1 Tax=Paenarthrobacter sp. S56 TaxID=3138179 RepID=UPI00321B1E61